MLAAIPYETFPIISLGPLQLRTFGLMVGLGVLVGSWFGARHCEKWGVPRDDSYRMATRMVIAGVIGARITWDLTHWSQIDTPLDLIAVWKGGLQFSGGFIAAIAVGYPTFLKWRRLQRWRVLDGYVLGLSVGLAIGRIGCTAVGEHFGRPTSFFLATRYDGGALREDSLFQHATPGNAVYGHTQPVPVTKGLVFHNTSIYELIYMLVLFAGLLWLTRRKPRVVAGTATGVFCLVYAIGRGGMDFLRVNDEMTFGLTGAQWMCAVLLPVSLWMLFVVRRATASLEAEEGAETLGSADAADGVVAAPAGDAVSGDAHTADTADREPVPSEGQKPAVGDTDR